MRLLIYYSFERQAVITHFYSRSIPLQGHISVWGCRTQLSFFPIPISFNAKAKEPEPTLPFAVPDLGQHILPDICILKILSLLINNSLSGKRQLMNYNAWLYLSNYIEFWYKVNISVIVIRLKGNVYNFISWLLFCFPVHQTFLKEI